MPKKVAMSEVRAKIVQVHHLQAAGGGTGGK
jgi:hypothetical protein